MTKLYKVIATVILISSVFAHLSCNGDDDDGTNCDEAVCTTELVTISVSVTDQDQNPVALDSFEVLDLESGEDMTISLNPSEFEDAQQRGIYPLIMDNVLGVNQEIQIQFKGFLNEEEVISGDFTVGTDCCHVGLISGNLQLTL